LECGLPSGWTEGRRQGFLIGVLRAGHKRWPIKIEVKNSAKLGKKQNPETGRLAEFYQCSGCGGEFTNANVEVDHISPVVDPAVGFVDWNTLVCRLFSPKENYQLLCKSCHQIKTNHEKKLKKEAKNK
jgi:5-methylcytosine-specific restriction endonuclease McrA